MSSYDLPPAGEGTLSAFGDRDAVTTVGIEPTPVELADDGDTLTGQPEPPARAQRVLSTAKDKAAAAASKARAAVPQKARQAGQAVRGNPKTSTATVLLIVLAAVAGTVLTNRRRTTKAQAARSRWSKLINR